MVDESDTDGDDDVDDVEVEAPVSTVMPFPAPPSFTPPPPVVASVTPFAPRASAFAGATADKAAAELKNPTPQFGPWASLGPELMASVTKEPDMPRIDSPALASEPEVRPAPEAARVKTGRPSWQSPWAIAAVLVLIAITTGVTIVGRKAQAPVATPASTGTLEIGTNPDGVAVFIDGANRGTTPLTVTLSPGAHAGRARHRRRSAAGAGDDEGRRAHVALHRDAPDRRRHGRSPRAHRSVEGQGHGRREAVRPVAGDRQGADRRDAPRHARERVRHVQRRRRHRSRGDGIARRADDGEAAGRSPAPTSRGGLRSPHPRTCRSSKAAVSWAAAAATASWWPSAVTTSRW